MSNSEKKVFDSQGKFAVAMKNGRKVNNVSWVQCRVLLSNKRLILVSNGGKQTFVLSNVRDVGGRADASQSIAAVSNYLTLTFTDKTLVIAAKSQEEFRNAFYQAVLNQKIVHVKHPVVEGGVVQDTSWVKSRVSIQEDLVMLALQSGSLVEIEVGEVTEITKTTTEISGEERYVLQTAHVDEDTSVETHITCAERKIRFMETLLEKGEKENEINADLSASEKEVLMALYSGVQPFTIPEFTGQNVDTVEETFERLIELDIVDHIRDRREVVLNSRGRNMASEAMNEE